uniref:Uncharacterized protein n=1 Tax=Magallana gigas TaxID=29159 RepID=A0A8W8I3E8_MAGGI
MAGKGCSEDLTGENWIELLELAGKDPNDEDFEKLLLHFCILHANEKGQPERQDLHDPELGHSSATTEDREIEMVENVGSYKIQQLKSRTRMVHRFSRRRTRLKISVPNPSPVKH